MKRIFISIVAVVFLFAGCNAAPDSTKATGNTEQPPEVLEESTQISLSDSVIKVDGKEISRTGTDAVYAANDIVFYLSGQDFTYGEGTSADEHEQSEADKHTVVHITKAGKYALSGSLSAGQIAVDLGEDAEDDPNAVVTLVFNGADISCSVAPAVIFYNVYECGSDDEESAAAEVDTSAAGANVVIADGTKNNINGSYVARIYESYELNEEGTEVVDSEKLHKYDGAFYSKMSMNVTGGEKGDGVLNINAENEGLDSELHLTVNGGNININSGNDGINTNEDNVSVTTINGGNLNIVVNGSTGEGDGIDSNGWLVINGGSVIASACGISGDAGIDSDKGIYINGGSVYASGNMLDRIENSNYTNVVFNFASKQKGGSEYSIRNSDGETVVSLTPANEFSCLVIADEKITEGNYTLWIGNTQLEGVSSYFGGGMRPMEGERPELPEGETIPMDGGHPELPEGETMSDGMVRPESPEPPEGFSMPENMTPPEGEEMNRPDRFDGGQMPHKDNLLSGEVKEASKIFEIKKGANTFVSVAPTK